MAIMNVWPSIPSRSSASRNAWTQSSTATMCRRIGPAVGMTQGDRRVAAGGVRGSLRVVHQLLPHRDAESSRRRRSGG